MGNRVICDILRDSSISFWEVFIMVLSTGKMIVILLVLFNLIALAISIAKRKWKLTFILTVFNLGLLILSEYL